MGLTWFPFIPPSSFIICQDGRMNHADCATSTVLSVLCSLCWVHNVNRVLTVLLNKWQVCNNVQLIQLLSDQLCFQVSVLTVIPVRTISVSHLSVPVPRQILQDHSSVWGVRHSCSTEILLSDATVEMKNGTQWNLSTFRQQQLLLKYRTIWTS